MAAVQQYDGVRREKGGILSHKREKEHENVCAIILL